MKAVETMDSGQSEKQQVVGGDRGQLTDSKKPVKKKRKPPEKPWKKPSDMPKRPLSAYNLFFKDERERIRSARGMQSSPTNAPGGASQSTNVTPKGGGLGFAKLAKTIAARWKDLDAVTKGPYEKQAAVDKARYDKAVAIWREKERAKKDESNQSKRSATANLVRASSAPDPILTPRRVLEKPESSVDTGQSNGSYPSDWFESDSTGGSPHRTGERPAQRMKSDGALLLEPATPRNSDSFLAEPTSPLTLEWSRPMQSFQSQHATTEDNAFHHQRFHQEHLNEQIHNQQIIQNQQMQEQIRQQQEQLQRQQLFNQQMQQQMYHEQMPQPYSHQQIHNQHADPFIIHNQQPEPFIIHNQLQHNAVGTNRQQDSAMPYIPFITSQERSFNDPYRNDNQLQSTQQQAAHGGHFDQRPLNQISQLVPAMDRFSSLQQSASALDSGFHSFSYQPHSSQQTPSFGVMPFADLADQNQGRDLGFGNLASAEGLENAGRRQARSSNSQPVESQVSVQGHPNEHLDESFIDYLTQFPQDAKGGGAPGGKGEGFSH
eukprot:CAMPEP_0172453294 /NCGR_PEP_ID=MMETSP1065-20121228/10685_1 /TAXON_ID=265537 /ORGANISM="Amphiprora paludosa, Strain CCMP125" /LENGTH=545 /DNA_ID=CAMNT_0013205473 /DNA_START=84 /DNA_END=1721 /DNA_ORIENTATION=+